MMPDAYAGYLPLPPDALEDALAQTEAPGFFLVEGLGPLAVVGRARIGRILWAHGAGAGHQSSLCSA